MALGGCAARPPEPIQVTTTSLDLRGPNGRAAVTIVDRAGVVVGASGAFVHPDVVGTDGLSLASSSAIAVRWAGSCSERTRILVERTGVSGISVRVDVENGAEGSTCTPRGFLRHLVVLETNRPFSPADLTFVDTRVPATPGLP